MDTTSLNLIMNARSGGRKALVHPFGAEIRDVRQDRVKQSMIWNPQSTSFVEKTTQQRERLRSIDTVELVIGT